MKNDMTDKTFEQKVFRIAQINRIKAVIYTLELDWDNKYWLTISRLKEALMFLDIYKEEK